MTYREALDAVIGSVKAFVAEENADAEAHKASRGEALRLLAESVEKAEAALLEPEEPLPEPPPVEPPAPEKELPLVPWAFPPLLQNRGSWPASAGSHEIRDGGLWVTIRQDKQPAPRVLRHDFGLARTDGGGGFQREPVGRLRRYKLKVIIPADYSKRADGPKVNVFQAHTDTAREPPILSFLLWNGMTRWRHDKPNEAGRADYRKATVKLGHAYKLEVLAKWTREQDGILLVWEDEQVVFTYHGATIGKKEDGPYVIIGMYAPSIEEAYNETIGFADFRMGDA